MKVNYEFSCNDLLGKRDGTVNLKFEKPTEMKIEPSNFKIKAGEKKFIDLKYKYSSVKQKLIILGPPTLVSSEASSKFPSKAKAY